VVELKKSEREMVAITCRRCGSDKIRKNGLKRTGRQQIHCRNCNFYSTIDLKTSERESRQQIADRLYSERLSQHAPDESDNDPKNLKKSNIADSSDVDTFERTPYFGNG
jgi:transposase-like protein